MKWIIDLPQLQSVRVYGFGNTKSFGISNLPSLQSLEISGFSGASSFILIGMVEWMKWQYGLPQLLSVKLGDYAFQYTTLFEMSNLTSLQTIDFGRSCFSGDIEKNTGGASSFSLIGMNKQVKQRVDLPQLGSVKLGSYAFCNTKPFAMTNLPSLQSLYFGYACLNRATSFSLTGMNWMDEVKSRSSSTWIYPAWEFCVWIWKIIWNGISTFSSIHYYF